MRAPSSNPSGALAALEMCAMEGEREAGVDAELELLCRSSESSWYDAPALLEAELHRALRCGELRLSFQPVWNLAASSLHGYEALLRWAHPGLGWLPAGAFLPLLRDEDLLSRVSSWALERACGSWQHLRAISPDAVLRVNLCAPQLADARLPAQIADALRASGMPAQRLRLEVSSAMLEGAGDALSRLHAMRVSLELEDFGPDTSSVLELHRHPLDAVKIDPSLVRALASEPLARGAVVALVRCASALGLSVNAEGVERREEVHLLRALGCSAAQGYALSPPAALPLKPPSASGAGRA